MADLKVTWKADLEVKLAKVTNERDAALKDAASWKREFEMYARAWQRELGSYGIYNKTHLIDALVKTTREIVGKYEEWKAETALMKERRRQEEIATNIGWNALLPIDFEVLTTQWRE